MRVSGRPGEDDRHEECERDDGEDSTGGGERRPVVLRGWVPGAGERPHHEGPHEPVPRVQHAGGDEENKDGRSEDPPARRPPRSA